MPSRNTIKSDIDADQQFYHVYARGASKQPIFVDAADYTYFTGLFARYLSADSQLSKTGEIYPHFYGKIELLAYCQMGNHFHLLFYQKVAGTMPKLMRSIMTSYSRYFNLRYRRSGSLFESRYKAALVDNQAYLEHISRYIHLNPRYWRRYAYSSLPYYLDDDSAEWIVPERILQLFADPAQYLTFLQDYESEKEVLNILKSTLADS